MSDSEEKSTFHLELERQGCAAILEGKNWLSAGELGRRIAVPAANLQAAINQWLYGHHCIFSISVEGGPLFPSYVFDEHWHTLRPPARLMRR